ncbi:MAG: GTPase HflX [Clostridiales bacterium]|nr:GTPase HflX [Clostridiales bacterium]
MIRGNIDGIRQSDLNELERLFDMELERDQFLPDRLLSVLIRFTEELNRELMVYVSRGGEVLEISVGSASSVSLPERSLRRSEQRLSGIRCIHTHPGGDARLSDVDEQALRLMRFDAMCAVGVRDGRATGITAAFLGELEYDRLSIHIHGPVKPGRVPQSLWLREIDAADQRVADSLRRGDVEKTAERVLLIGMDSEESLRELESLAQTAGGIVVSRALQKRQKPDPATYIGSGKAQELALTCQVNEIDLAIFDEELTGAQTRNLSEALGVRVVDRAALILDIFASRAQSHEGKLQVELAQLKYTLPRLTGMGAAMSRLGGGIGTRGPGETQLEVDRRVIRRRIADNEQELRDLSRQRDLRRARREKTDQVVVALVGYTNAGKSSLMNALSGASVLVEDKLFATLDPVVRRIELPENRQCLLVDTVGFIRKLPHQLVEAFKSTLEEALTADLIVVVSDAASDQYEKQRAVVLEVLADLGVGGKPMIEALNKVDAVKDRPSLTPDAIPVSAVTGEGLDSLRAEIGRRIARLRHRVRVVVPYHLGGVLSLIHDKGQVLSEEYLEAGTSVTCMLDGALYARVEKALPGGVVELV